MTSAVCRHQLHSPQQPVARSLFPILLYYIRSLYVGRGWLISCINSQMPLSVRRSIIQHKIILSKQSYQTPTTTLTSLTSFPICRSKTRQMWITQIPSSGPTRPIKLSWIMPARARIFRVLSSDLSQPMRTSSFIWIRRQLRPVFTLNVYITKMLQRGGHMAYWWYWSKCKGAHNCGV